MAEIIVAEILKAEENGIEYFTVAATGESGMSQRGLARACGKSHTAIQKIEKLVATGGAGKRLNRFTGQALRVATNSPGMPIVYASNFCSAVIKHYAYQGSEIAQDIDDLTSDVGITHFIQAKTGWTPEQYKAAPQAQAKIDRILNSPDPWRKLYEKEFCDRAFKWFGGRFYWDFCYCWMTPEEKAKHERLNPILRNLNGQTGRKYKIHQLIDFETRDRLTPRIRELAVLIGSNPTKERFLNGYCNLYGQGWQLELFREDAPSVLIV